MSTAAASTISGIVVVDKPAGLTSHDVVARVRRLARTRKVGHAGTLDPMATGVLLLGVNKGTRLLGHLALSDKRYDATIRLGAATTTDDAEGELTLTPGAAGLTEDQVRAAAAAFVGDIEQVPSTVSAIKVDGKRAYALAREGREVTLRARPVTVHSFEVRDVGAPTEVDGVVVVDVDVAVHCSTGTYVRALARDLGERLGSAGHLTRLRRTTIGAITLDGATDLDRALEEGTIDVLPLEAAVPLFFETVEATEEQAREVSFGRRLELGSVADGTIRAVMGPDGRFLALYAESGESWKPVAVFSPANEPANEPA